MPEIELEPHEYADRDPKSGKWRRPISKRAAMLWFMLAAGCVAYVVFRANEMTPALAVCVGAMFAFFAGVMAANWLKDVY